MAANEMSLENLGLDRLFTPESIAAIKPVLDTCSDDHVPGQIGVRDAEPDYDFYVHEAHGFMYRGLPAHMALTGIDVGRIQKVQDDEMMRLLGLPDRKACRLYFMEHGPADPEIVSALLEDALSSGRWQELPDALQAEYHKRVVERGVL